jgi:transcriptional regulator with XRE-family HTH domain
MQTGLKAAREKRRLTQTQLAERSGVSAATISRIEAGEILNPSTETARKLEEALRVARGALVFGDVKALAS